MPPFALGVIAAPSGADFPPPTASCSAANFFKTSIVTPLPRADSSVACRYTLSTSTVFRQPQQSLATTPPSLTPAASYHVRPTSPVPLRNTSTNPPKHQHLYRTTEEEKKDLLRYHRIILPLCRLHRLLPPRRAQTPLAPRLQPDAPQVVPPGGGEVEEFLGQKAGHGVVAGVLGADAAVAVAVEAGHGRLGEESEGLFEDCRVRNDGALVRNRSDQRDHGGQG